MPSMSARSGTEKPQVGILQLATVRPHPHWQVNPWETSALVGVPAANVSRETFFSSGERKMKSATTASASRGDDANANCERTDSITPASAQVGEFAVGAGRTAQHGRDCGALAHVGPHHNRGAEHHQQAAEPYPEDQGRQKHFEGRGLTAVVDSGQYNIEVVYGSRADCDQGRGLLRPNVEKLGRRHH